MAPTDLADRYFACIRAKDLDGFVALFAEDAVMVLPSGRELSGTAAIREMQAGAFAHGGAKPMPLAKVVAEKSVAVENRAEMPDGSARHTAIFFHLNAQGQIQWLSIYMRSG